MQTVPCLNSIQSPIYAYYLTHLECQNANKNCTTNAVNDCINLSECSQYQRQESCQLEINGYNIKIILSQQQVNVCGRNVYAEIEFSPTLVVLLIYNVINTFQLLLLMVSVLPNKIIINIIYQICVLMELKVNVVGIQRLINFKIELIKQASCQKTLSNCIINGVNCINKDTCSRYITKIACNVGDTDGNCILNDKALTCSLIMSRTQADKYQKACLQASDRCAIKYHTSQTLSSCYTHTYDLFQQQWRKQIFLYLELLFQNSLFFYLRQMC